MQKKLKDFFNDTSRRGKKVVSGLAAAFLLAAGPLPVDAAKKNPTPREPTPISAEIFHTTTYWKHPDYDVITRIEPCEETGLCLTIYDLNPKDQNVKTLLAKLRGVGKPVDSPFGFGTVYEPAPELIDDWYVNIYCNYTANVKLIEDPKDGTWSGTIHSPFTEKDYGIRLEAEDENTLKASGFFTNFPLLKLSTEAKRIKNPPPGCY